MSIGLMIVLWIKAQGPSPTVREPVIANPLDGCDCLRSFLSNGSGQAGLRVVAVPRKIDADGQTSDRLRGELTPVTNRQ